ncbi:AMP-binding enzyme family protein (macronuclear) [Tetrahymena thermophila SB210]|uniref:AMP-binding enzyme family protein n=1 Tax=Tetrahymena thermophila (strain SB210) TaxID=312017 RepID=Q245Z3_TETTS|nr:AMP-binding enzyme family protein [Tetrahymena thermophila SB210]EAS03490.2 AMP-binding enzyme family protein [Tetrahymena thermophila SB210]|eukprot:XP_001023735.2 AMP-binding enzyme family protein [Tetrahymena thermophila SB210]
MLYGNQQTYEILTKNQSTLSHQVGNQSSIQKDMQKFPFIQQNKSILLDDNKPNSLETNYFEKLQNQLDDKQNSTNRQIKPTQQIQLEGIVNQVINLSQDQENQNKDKNSKVDKQHSNIYFKMLQVLKSSENSVKVYNKLFKNRFCKKKSDYTEENLNENLKQKINCLITKDLNIFTFYKDILFLKKAIMILLSQEQLAMLQLVGCSNDYLDLDQSNLENLLRNEENHFSHFEKQKAIILSEEINYMYIQKFLKRSKSKENLSKIDQRIISSLPNNIKNA